MIVTLGMDMNVDILEVTNCGALFHYWNMLLIWKIAFSVNAFLRSLKWIPITMIMSCNEKKKFLVILSSTDVQHTDCQTVATLNVRENLLGIVFIRFGSSKKSINNNGAKKYIVIGILSDNNNNCSQYNIEEQPKKLKRCHIIPKKST